jgi:hypothetical protein
MRPCAGVVNGCPCYLLAVQGMAFVACVRITTGSDLFARAFLPPFFPSCHSHGKLGEFTAVDLSGLCMVDARPVRYYPVARSTRHGVAIATAGLSEVA